MALAGQGLAATLNTDWISTGKELYPNESRFYDLISWDPRDVGFTTPLVEGVADPLVRDELDQKFLESRHPCNIKKSLTELMP